MSVTKQMMEKAPKKPKKNGKSLGFGLKFIAFHPTTQEKKLIRDDTIGWTEIIDRLQSCLNSELAISIKRDDYRDCISLVIRENVPFGDEGIAISFWHTDVLTCFQQMCVAFDDRYKDFPEAAQLSLPEEDVDW